ncbi:MAG: AraC family transcriptional regulator ligand-binding domain-containing protein [Myxococcota bacterium]
MDARTVCSRADVRHAEMSDSRGRISSSQLVRLWSAAAELNGDPHLGLHAAEAASWPPSHVVAALSTSGETLGEGMRRVERYAGLLADRPWHRIEEVGSEVHSLMPGLCEHLPHHAEYVTALAQRAYDLCSAEPITAKEVWFRHPYRGGSSEYERFFRCRVRFAQKCCGMIFSRSVWNTPIAGWDPAWAEQLEAWAFDAEVHLKPSSFVDSVRAVVQRTLSTGPCNVETTARALGMSARTLQRRLQEEGTNFRNLIDEVRIFIVEKSRARGMSSEHAIQRAGFADVRAYRRTIRRCGVPSKP